ncbi:hypothetical protein BBJ28_00013643 [Nothophytophthora sp. Chile5]|nr:hypothetical protein BBJ28_00013643 [Nothophytophthora sp. Chile5]
MSTRAAACGRGSFSFGSSRSSSKKPAASGDPDQHGEGTGALDGADQVDSPAKGSKAAEVAGVMTISETDTNERKMEGFLLFRGRVRRRRYCILQGHLLRVFKSKPTDCASPGVPKKQINVVGVKDALALEKSVRVALLGSGDAGSFENTLVISTHKSKLVVAEAETHTEKERWLHAMSTIHLVSSDSEKTFFQSLLEAEDFDAHLAVTLLHKHRTNVVATELVLDRLASYAEQNVDDVEFYIQQIVHLIVNTELAATAKLVHLLLSICRAKAYVEHLGNCIHLALQLFWLLEAKIEDKDPKTYNLCAKLLMSIEAKVVNQQFELPSTQTADDVTRHLMDIPHMKERLQQMTAANEWEIESKTALPRPPEILTSLESESSDPTGSLSPPGAPPSASISSIRKEMPSIGAADVGNGSQQPALLLQWMEKERQKRYKYFHQQRDFVKALTDISERMRAVDPPQERKKLLPAELKALVVPDMAYVPLGRVSDPFSRITRVLVDEGTVFSTHSRAPCLLCFEVIEDQVNSAGHRSSTVAKTMPKASPRALGSVDSSGSLSSSGSILASEEAQVAALIKQFAIKGQLICVENASAADEDDEDDVDTGNDNTDAAGTCSRRASDSPPFVLPDLESVVNSPSATALTPNFDAANEAGSKESPSKADDTDSRRLSLIRGYSKTAYELGLSKLLNASDVFGESWQAKKERIRASSPFGHLPGWNVISLISKSNDDIRQEVFAMQLITTFQTIFRESELPLWLRPYRIVSTGRNSGLLETITDAQSLDALKKQNGYTGLRAHFERTYGTGDALKTAQRSFLHSLAAYSVVCYLLQIKDRHNGNILLDTEGHLVHIDFGFMLGIAPGGNWSFETAPFKLTKEMVAVLGGVSSALFGEFVQLVALGMLAAQRHADKVVALVEIMMHNSTFPCFQGRDVSRDLQKLRGRFLLHCSTEQTVKAVVKMIHASYKNKWTKRYDQFQKITNGIVP